MFDRKLSIYVPSTFGENSPADMSLVDEAKKTVHVILCNRFGGSTEVSANGKWVNEHGQIVSESISVCYAAIDESVEDEYLHETAVLLADYVKTAMLQSCVLWTVEHMQGDLQ